MHCKGKSCTNLTSEGKISTLNALHNNDNILHFARIVLLSLFYFACFLYIHLMTYVMFLYILFCAITCKFTRSHPQIENVTSTCLRCPLNVCNDQLFYHIF